MFVFQGAATTCYVALNPQLKGVTGKYFADCNEQKTSKLAKTDASWNQLWKFSKELISSGSRFGKGESFRVVHEYFSILCLGRG
jgi:hypothetical protein